MTEARAGADRCHRALQPARAARAVRPRRSVSRARHEARTHGRRSTAAGRLHRSIGRRLIAGARGLSALSHPNVTTLFDVGEHDGRVYLAFEFQKGQSLRAESAGRPMNVRRAVEIAIQIADAVADAHAHGFGHGGLSPDSVVISAKGRAKIPAFELASQSGFDKNGNDGRLIDYDSPEEARGEAPDDRSDVYSVGAILYETLTTRRPMHRGASAPSASNPNVPNELDEIVLKALVAESGLAFSERGGVCRRAARVDRGARCARCCRRGRGARSDAVNQHGTRGPSWPAACWSWSLRLRGGCLGKRSGVRQDFAKLLRERRARQHLIDAGAARARRSCPSRRETRSRACGLSRASGRPSSPRSCRSAPASRC